MSYLCFQRAKYIPIPPKCSILNTGLEFIFLIYLLYCYKELHSRYLMPSFSLSNSLEMLTCHRDLGRKWLKIFTLLFILHMQSYKVQNNYIYPCEHIFLQTLNFFSYTADMMLSDPSIFIMLSKQIV